MPDPNDPIRTAPHVSFPSTCPAVTTDATTDLSSAPETEATGGFPAVPGFEVLREIAHGGMGLVLAARDLTLDREVAVKVLLPGRNSADAVARFLTESKVTAKLPHPGVPPVHQLGILADGAPFLAMKLIQGRTLAGELRAVDRAASLPRLLQVFEQICQTVGFAHSRGIIHRDLKPANVMVGEFGEVQVMDWGLARAGGGGRAVVAEDVGPDTGTPARPAPAGSTGERVTCARSPAPPDGVADAAATVAGAVMGTPAYMAPEQARGERVDTRADVFALGGVLCEILTGCPPFRGPTALEVVKTAAAGDLSEAFARLGGCGADPELIGLAKRCLAPNAGERPADAGEVARVVAGYRAGVEERLRRAEQERAAAEVKAAEQRKRRRVQFALFAAVGLLLAAGGLFAWYEERQTEKNRLKQAEFETEQARLDGERKLVEGRAASDREHQEREIRKRVPALLQLSVDLRKQYKFAAAKDSLDQAGELASSGLTDDLRDVVEQAKEDLLFVRALDDIRYQKWKFSRFEGRGMFGTDMQAGVGYRAQFLRRGYDFERGDTRALATRIAASPIRDELLAALDDWSVSTDINQATRVMEVARRVEPGEWLDEFRNPDVRVDREALRRQDEFGFGVLNFHIPADLAALRRLARTADPAAIRPATATALADLMKEQELAPSDLLNRFHAHFPSDFRTVYTLAHYYHDCDPRRAIAFYRAARALRPDNTGVMDDLGCLLLDVGEVEEAEALFRKTVDLLPNDPIPLDNLGRCLLARGDVEGAISCHRSVVVLLPRRPVAHKILGDTLSNAGDSAGAIEAYRSAVRESIAYEGLYLPPRSVAYHVSLAHELRFVGQHAEAIAVARNAIRLDPNYPYAHLNLGLSLQATGKFAEAVESLRRGHNLGVIRPGWKTNSAAWIKDCEELLRGEKRLTEIRENTGVKPANAAEWLLLARVCKYRREYVDSVRYYEGAFAADPALVANPNRYDAACFAALAGTGAGVDPPPAAARSAFREKAFAWLSAELTGHKQRLTGGKGTAAREVRDDIHRKLRHWTNDPDFVTVRHLFYLLALPPDESARWRAFWDEVRTLRDKTTPPAVAPPPRRI